MFVDNFGGNDIDVEIEILNYLLDNLELLVVFFIKDGDIWMNLVEQFVYYCGNVVEEMWVVIVFQVLCCVFDYEFGCEFVWIYGFMFGQVDEVVFFQGEFCRVIND